ncbi:nicotinate phosphoribosyltransferase [archaeon]|nr:MAG: nicotinate phosphoribosyltransferase [archaeon]
MVKTPPGRLFWIAREEEIKSCKTTDVYFEYTDAVLREAEVNPKVVMEIYPRKLPYEGNWGVLTGVYDVAKLLEGLPIDVYSMEEGEIFFVSEHGSVAHEPVMQIIGRYRDFLRFENPILGFLCHSTGISTKAARVKLIAGEKKVFEFGTRRVHPVLAPLIERSAYIGGMDSVSNVLGAELMGQKPVGTMPHALILCFGRQEDAWEAFDRALPKEIPRIALIDTFSDEKDEALRALRLLGKRLHGVRIDTPGSRRGDFKAIIEEVRWELDVHGGEHVKIYVSGGLDENSVAELVDVADGFGVGTSISNAPVIDFSAKIVEVYEDGKQKPIAKKGDVSGRKAVYRDWRNLVDYVTLYGVKMRRRSLQQLLTPLIRDGKIVREFKDVEEIRETVLSKLRRIRSGGAPRIIMKPSW